MSRSVQEIANEAYDDYRRIMNNCAAHGEHVPRYIIHSMPYLQAMMAMFTVKQKYGAEDGEMVVLYFLNNAHHWRGDVAKRIKAELNQLLKEAKQC